MGLFDLELFKKAWGRFPTGVSVISSVEANDMIHGVTANGIMSVSLNPLLVLISLAHTSKSFKIISLDSKYGINILNDNQQNIASYYATKSENKLDNKTDWFKLSKTGVPLLRKCLSSMSCEVVQAYKAGDHTLFLGKVNEIYVNEGEPLLYYNKEFNKLI